MYATFAAIRSYTRSGAFCRDTPVQTVLNPETLSVIVRVPWAIRFGLPVLLAHFAQRRNPHDRDSWVWIRRRNFGRADAEDFRPTSTLCFRRKSRHSLRFFRRPGFSVIIILIAMALPFPFVRYMIIPA